MKELIIIIDDSEVQVEIIDEYLRRAGFTNTRVFTNPNHALTALPEKEIPSLIITDYDMPGMNGAQVMDRLSARYHAVRGIIITGNSAMAHHLSERYPIIQKGTPDFFPQLLSQVRRTLAACE